MGSSIPGIEKYLSQTHFAESWSLETHHRIASRKSPVFWRNIMI
jgi:hypothetical protein